MKKIVFLTLCWLSPFLLYSQNEFLYSQNSIDWEQIEIRMADSLKTSLINSIKYPSINNLKNSGILLKYFDHFHFVDFNLDGKTDILYSGDAIDSEGKKTLYWLNTGIDYKLIFETDGEIVIINEISKVPVSLCIKYEPYDPSVIYLMDVFNIDIQNETIIFNKLLSSCIVKKTQIPKSFNLFVPFKVDLQNASLRLTAENDTTTDYFGFDNDGNEIAEYSKESIGYALYEKFDSFGCKWWFVVMVNNKKSIKENYHDWYDITIHPKLASKILNIGWMNCKYLNRIE
jgi:hypothetical protein